MIIILKDGQEYTRKSVLNKREGDDRQMKPEYATSSFIIMAHLRKEKKV